MYLGFQARSNKTYTIEFWDSSGQDSTNAIVRTTLENVNASPTNRTVTIPDLIPAGVSTRFYRLASPKLP